METAIQLEEMRFYAYHGVSDQERKVGNNYVVWLTVNTPLEGAMESDQLTQTINYAELYQLVRCEMEIPSRLIEHVAGRTVSAIRKRFPEITGMELKIKKLNPPIRGEVASAAVVIKF